MSNVGDASFGVHDIDERIVEHIIKEKAERRLTTRRTASEPPADVATVNAYSQLVKSIKTHVANEGVVTVDLVNMTGMSTSSSSSQKNEEGLLSQRRKSSTARRRSSQNDECTVDKALIARVLCKDIYDWSLAHIEKAIHQADVNDRDVDEIIIIGGPEKMPGFYEYLQRAYPNKSISFVPEKDLAVGAAIVVLLLFFSHFKNNKSKILK